MVVDRKRFGIAAGRRAAIVGGIAIICLGGLTGSVHAQPRLVDASSTTSPTAVYGAALRARWVSVPGWLLSTFLKQSVPLSSYGLGLELVRRKEDVDFALGLTYQNMSPRDGNWLGRSNVAALDTDLVQFRGLALVGLDASFTWRRRFNQYAGLRYGAGLGIGLLPGKVLRVSDAGCTDANAGDTRACRPLYCPPQGCTEAMHRQHEGGVDNGPTDPHRYQEPSIPGAFPIINLAVGLEFHVPQVPGLELRLDGGFYDAFVLGFAGAWLF